MIFNTPPACGGAQKASDVMLKSYFRESSEINRYFLLLNMKTRKCFLRQHHNISLQRFQFFIADVFRVRLIEILFRFINDKFRKGQSGCKSRRYGIQNVS